MTRAWKFRMVFVLAIAVLADVLLSAAGMGPRLVLVGAGVLVAAAILVLTLDLGDISTAMDWPTTPQFERRRDGTDWRVGTLRMLLINERRTDGANTRLYEALVGLIDDRLLAHHFVDRTLDSGAAREILGEELTVFVALSGPIRRLDQPREVAHIVTLIEQI